VVHQQDAESVPHARRAPGEIRRAGYGEERRQGRGQVRQGRARCQAAVRFLQDTAGRAAGDQQFKDAQKVPAAGERETFFLQAGAFQNAPDADNLKARLALLGIEATIQTATLPDKGVWHRVRIGPYGSIEELNRARETLKQNGYDTALIKTQDSTPPR
jgi:cell division protein FtsN